MGNVDIILFIYSKEGNAKYTQCQNVSIVFSYSLMAISDFGFQNTAIFATYFYCFSHCKFREICFISLGKSIIYIMTSLFNITLQICIFMYDAKFALVYMADVDHTFSHNMAIVDNYFYLFSWQF